MSLNYAASLSPYANKGKCGLPEKYDPIETVTEKCEILAKYINESKLTVVITGAGISTSCGIADFRGPKGVWTLEKNGENPPESSISFEDAIPSYAHYALIELSKIGKLHFLISQNIDGLHMRSGFPLNRLAELHGNMFVEKCNSCSAKHLNLNCVNTIGLRPTGKKCLKEKSKGICRGQLLDTILDWESSLPMDEMQKSELNCKKADLCLCLGTTLQIIPVGNYPLLTKKSGGKIVVVNLQETKIDKHADLIINNKLDFVFEILFEKMFKIKMKYNPKLEVVLRLPGDSENTNELLLNVSNVIIDPRYIKKEDDTSIKKNISIEPSILLLVSGKRKSGKDYLCSKIVDYLNNNHSDLYNILMITIASPIKQEYATMHNLDFEKLLDSSSYKEQYRLDMVNWSDAKRIEDPSYFCRKAIENSIQEKAYEKLNNKLNLFIVTDLRRRTDLNYFHSIYPNIIKTVRVLANEETRIKRGWMFKLGVDDASSECDLDMVDNWDFFIKNNNEAEFNNSFQDLISYLVNFSNF